METITIGQISLAVTFLVGLISGISYLRTHLKLWVGESVKDQFTKIENNIEQINKRLAEVDVENCKNFLVTIITEVEKGGWLHEVEKERFWEEYEHYVQMNGNSYIKRKVEQLEAEGKL